MLGMWGGGLSFYDDICVVLTLRGVSEPPLPPYTPASLTGDIWLLDCFSFEDLFFSQLDFTCGIH